MKLKDMSTQVRYIVTKGGSTLHKGDRVWLDYDGCLMNVEAMGWLMPQEWTRLKGEVEFDAEYYKRGIKELEEKIKLCEDLIEKNEVK